MSRSGKGSETGHRRPVLPPARLFLALFLLALFAPAAFAQEMEVPVVTSVEVWVDGVPDTENLESLISLNIFISV